MATLNSKFSIILKNKKEEVIGTADKVVYTVNKVKGDSYPKTASVAVYNLELYESDVLPDVFDIIGTKDEGIVQSTVRILNCSSKVEVNGCVNCIATSADAGV